MKSNQIKRKQVLNIIGLAGVVGSAIFGAQHAVAAGFSLLEQNVSGLGNAYAGSAAVAEDASTLYFNAAGMTQLTRPSLVVSLAGINIDSKFHDSGSAPALGQSLGGSGGNAGGFTALPAAYVTMPINDAMSAGIGVNAPFGLKTEYDNGWIGRFQALKSDVKTLNVNPALAFKVGSNLSFGIGLDYQKLDAELTSAVNYDAVVAGGLALQGASQGTIGTVIAANPGLQGISKVKGDDSGWGYDFGVLFTPSDATRVGLSYRSAIKYHLEGNVNFTTPSQTTAPPVSTVIAGARASSAPNGLADGPIVLDIKLPAQARLAAAQKLSDAVELLGEVSWTQWSSITELKIVRSNGVTLKNTPEKWDNTWRYAVGANYQLNPDLKLRAGVAFDQSPVPDATRTPRLADADRTWLSAGAKFNVGRVGVDVGYTHIFAKNAKLNQNDGSTTVSGLLLGTQKTSIDILGAQATVSF